MLLCSPAAVAAAAAAAAAAAVGFVSLAIGILICLLFLSIYF